MKQKSQKVVCKLNQTAFRDKAIQYFNLLNVTPTDRRLRLLKKELSQYAKDHETVKEY
jgi:hypothetical protein